MDKIMAYVNDANSVRIYFDVGKMFYACTQLKVYNHSVLEKY